MSSVISPGPRPTFTLPKLDWAWALILVSPLVWWALSQNGFVLFDHHHSAQPVSLPHHVMDSFIHIAPYFAFAIAIGAYAIASDSAELVNRAFAYNQPVAIGLAALAGTVSPLCSCGVIPLIAAMLVARVPLAPIMAFWLASPLMAPEQFLITQGALGVPFTLSKAAAALTIGLMGGYATFALSKRWDLSSAQILRAGLLPKSCCGSEGDTAQPHDQRPVVWAIWQDPARRVSFIENAWSTTLFLGKWMMLAFVLEALMLQLNLIGPLVSWLSNMGGFAIPLSALVGIPAYLNGDAAPLLVGGFVDQGLSQGAAMAFLIGGGVTCIPAAVAVWSLVRPRVFGLYLVYGIGGAIAAGFLTGPLIALFN